MLYRGLVDAKIAKGAGEARFPRPIQVRHERIRASLAFLTGTTMTTIAIGDNGRSRVGIGGIAIRHGNFIPKHIQHAGKGGQLADTGKVTRNVRAIQQNDLQKGHVRQGRKGPRESNVSIQHQIPEHRKMAIVSRNVTRKIIVIEIQECEILKVAQLWQSTVSIRVLERNFEQTLQVFNIRRNGAGSQIRVLG